MKILVKETDRTMDKAAREVMKELRMEGRRQMARSFLKAEVLPPVPGDPDKAELMKKLKQGGISSRIELTWHSPSDLIQKCGLTDGEVDALAWKCRFLRTREWLHRRRLARQRDCKRTLRTRYFR